MWQAAQPVLPLEGRENFDKETDTALRTDQSASTRQTDNSSQTTSRYQTGHDQQPNGLH